MMKIVRFSQNGHTPRLGCYVHQDKVMVLATSPRRARESD
jgi:hypothetical protein